MRRRGRLIVAAMVDVILVEESLTESALACIAIALRKPSIRVAQARHLEDAKAILERNAARPVLVILGWRALRNGLDKFFAAAQGRATVIGVAADVGQAGRERALRLGVQAIYDKPVQWGQYVSVMEQALGEWLAA